MDDDDDNLYPEDKQVLQDARAQVEARLKKSKVDYETVKHVVSAIIEDYREQALGISRDPRPYVDDDSFTTDDDVNPDRRLDCDHDLLDSVDDDDDEDENTLTQIEAREDSTPDEDLFLNVQVHGESFNERLLRQRFQHGESNGSLIKNDSSESSSSYSQDAKHSYSSKNGSIGASTSNINIEWKRVASKLIPFLSTASIFCIAFIPVSDNDTNLYVTAVFKCLPILALAIFVMRNGMNLQEKFPRSILIGLLFSCCGDALLVWPSKFLHGMGAFALAQVFYIRAFGFSSVNWSCGLVVLSTTAIMLGVIVPNLIEDVILLIGVVIYALLLATMVWRAVTHAQLHANRTTTNGQTTWVQTCSYYGGILFAISDGVLAINAFHTKVPYGQHAVMISYYLAQMGISLSVLHAKPVYEQRRD